jgi:hypothetical protein
MCFINKEKKANILNFDSRSRKISNLKIKMIDSKDVPQWMAKVDRRSGKDRRQFSYTAYIPERRCGKDRRIRKSSGRTHVLNIEDGGFIKAEEVRLKK